MGASTFLGFDFSVTLVNLSNTGACTLKQLLLCAVMLLLVLWNMVCPFEVEISQKKVRIGIT